MWLNAVSINALGKTINVHRRCNDVFILTTFLSRLYLPYSCNSSKDRKAFPTVETGLDMHTPTPQNDEYVIMRKDRDVVVKGVPWKINVG